MKKQNLWKCFNPLWLVTSTYSKLIKAYICVFKHDNSNHRNKRRNCHWQRPKGSNGETDRRRFTGMWKYLQYSKLKGEGQQLIPWSCEKQKANEYKRLSIGDNREATSFIHTNNVVLFYIVWYKHELLQTQTVLSKLIKRVRGLKNCMLQLPECCLQLEWGELCSIFSTVSSLHSYGHTGQSEVNVLSLGNTPEMLSFIALSPVDNCFCSIPPKEEIMSLWETMGECMCLCVHECVTPQSNLVQYFLQ